MSDVAFSRASLIETELPPYPGIGLEAITLVADASAAQAALADLLAAKVIGFDTESKPTFLKGEVSTGPYLVQLATDRHTWLFPIVRGRGVAEVKAVLESPDLLKVGFGLGNDHSALKSRLDIEVCNVLDLGEILRGPAHRGTVGAKVAVAHFFGQKLQKSKKIGTSNWSAARLNERQVLYAANDAHVALQVYYAWQASRRAALPA